MCAIIASSQMIKVKKSDSSGKILNFNDQKLFCTDFAKHAFIQQVVLNWTERLFKPKSEVVIPNLVFMQTNHFFTCKNTNIFPFAGVVQATAWKNEFVSAPPWKQQSTK